MPYRVLAVDSDQKALAAMKQMLTSAGYLVVCESEFEGAKRRLAFAPPDLLVTSIRLGAYNGLHLVLRARDDNPAMPAIVRDVKPDPVLEKEAQKLGATYFVGPIERESLVALADRLLASTSAKMSSAVERRWPRKPATVSVSVAGADAKLVDASYGGLRLELTGVPNERLSRIDAISIPGVGRLPVQPVWARGGIDAPPVWWCGVEVAQAERETNTAWRIFVDSLN